MSSRIIRKEKECSSCKRAYVASSNHKSCPKCRSIHAKTPCLKCGGLCGRIYELCALCSNVRQKGELNFNWKGGAHKTSGGYIQRYAAGHPRLRSNCKAPYVLDHILVMEKKIGRYLLQGENVHHINGVKDDNRPENLELWTRHQPSGQRAKDLLAYARELIVLYEPLEDKL